MAELKPCDGNCAECESSYGVDPHLYCSRIRLCPFCFREAGISQSVSTKGWKVVCERCGGQTRFFRTPSQAIKAWNRRNQKDGEWGWN